VCTIPESEARVIACKKSAVRHNRTVIPFFSASFKKCSNSFEADTSGLRIRFRRSTMKTCALLDGRAAATHQEVVEFWCGQKKALLLSSTLRIFVPLVSDAAQD